MRHVANWPFPGHAYQLPRRGHADRFSITRRVRALGVTTRAVLWDSVAAADPGRLRLLLAARGVLSVGLAATLLFAVAAMLHQPPTVFAAGVVISMLGPFLMRDVTARQRRRTLLLLLIAAIGAAIASSLLWAIPFAGEAFFLLLLFAGMMLQASDPRAIGLGLVAVVISYVGLYLKLPPQTLPLQCLGLCLGAAATALACFLLLPLRPASTLQLAVRSVQRRAARVLREARATPGTGVPPRILQRHLGRLNEAALAAEDQLEVIDEASRTALRLHLFELEQAVMQLMSLLAAAAWPVRLHARLALAETRLRHGRPSARDSGASASPDALHQALVALNHAASRLDRMAARAVADPEWRPVAAKAVRGQLAWRMAFQVTLASVLAMAGGMALSPQRWFWAVVSVYIVFLNARSRGEAIYRGLHRIVGTLAGLFAGLLIAVATDGDLPAQCAVMLMAVFSMYYFYAVSYGTAIFAVTILLGMLYGVLGSPLEPLLLLRLEETTIGVVAAMLAAAFVLPVPTRHQVSLSGQGVLRAMQDVVRLSRLSLGGQCGLAPIEAVRRLDRQIVDLRRSLAPLAAGRFVLRRGRSARSVTALLACAQWARSLAAASRLPDQAEAALIAPQASIVEARITAMLDATAAPAVALPAAGSQAGGGRAAVALRHLDLALMTLAERLRAGVLDGFAVD